LTNEIENRETEYYLQASALKSGVCDFRIGFFHAPKAKCIKNIHYFILNGCQEDELAETTLIGQYLRLSRKIADKNMSNKSIN